MTKAIGAGYSPNIGIERIIGSQEGPGAAILPQSTRVVPTDVMTSMEALHELYASSWDKSMQKFLQPRIDARELLIPGVFTAQIRRARAELAEAARKKKSAALRKAALLMEEDEEIKSLLDFYRNLLLQG
jgi:hypothetical protein